MSEAVTETTETATEATQEVAEVETPPWGDDFDAEKAWKLVQNLKADKEKLSARPTLSKEQKAKLAEFDRLEQASKTDLERANEQIDQFKNQATAFQTRAVRAEVRALAATDFADPDDAAAFLDLSEYVSDSGDIDTTRITADLSELLTKKPHLGKAPDGSRPPRPDASQGSAGRSAASDPATAFAAFMKNQ